MQSSDTRAPPLSTILLRIEERLTAIEDLILARSAPAIAIDQAHDDLLRIRGITAQSGEVIGHQRDQMQALAEGVLHFGNRLITHDRQSAIDRRAIHVELVQVHTLLAVIEQIAEQATSARQLLLTEAAGARGVLKEEEADARAELRADAEDVRDLERARHADAATEVLQIAASTAAEVLQIAASTAAELLHGSTTTTEIT
jgi:hypothetical protein